MSEILAIARRVNGSGELHTVASAPFGAAEGAAQLPASFTRRSSSCRESGPTWMF